MLPMIAHEELWSALALYGFFGALFVVFSAGTTLKKIERRDHIRIQPEP